MIDFYFWTSPNPFKVSIMLEEIGLPYNLIPVNVHRGEQHTPEFLALNPNGKLPVILDRDTAGEPITVFESGAILLYLGDKTGQLIPPTPEARLELMQWLMWQMSALGPMSGQAVHFQQHAPEQLDYPITRYRREVARLYGVLDRRLVDRTYLMGNDYTILDISVYGWLHFHTLVLGELNPFANLHRWFTRLSERPGVERGLKVGAEFREQSVFDAPARKALFGQDVTSTGEYLLK
ncbi:glutathione S-transferase family protein [Iningainema tapete]|uniref:Glutathione S-transferase N-terminal domain-containing protein n=1 Tax=Iningainema tapete BLCC-T55 TaxID=2748662 RepID=A0A8J7BWD6_9CYAN|nr:glutathione S-transferase N-terminal domain-containing protein [Iningainema tapete]MBD2771647.1 glutathione S-transferase N-terminal domain-containing protein [Iningainema tapete BLCC-T55]